MSRKNQQDLTSPPEFYTAVELARLLRVSGRTLRRWLDKKLLNYYIIGGKFLFRRSAVELFLAQRKVEAGEIARPLEPANWSPRTRNKKTGRVAGVDQSERSAA